MSNPFLERGEKKAKQSNAYWRSKKQEKDLSKRFNGYKITGSGSKHKKGDVCIAGIARIEAKATQNKSFSVTQEMVEKIERASLLSNELPIIAVEFLDDRGKKVNEVAVVSLRSLELLINELTNENSRKAG